MHGSVTMLSQGRRAGTESQRAYMTGNNRSGREHSQLVWVTGIGVPCNSERAEIYKKKQIKEQESATG